MLRRHFVIVEGSILDWSCLTATLACALKYTPHNRRRQVSTITETKSNLPTGTWNVDPVHSQVGFAVEYGVGTFRGSFSPVGAQVEVDEGGAATLSGSVPVSGVKVQDENLSAHLQSPEF